MKNIVLYFFLINLSITVISAQGFTGLSFGVGGGFSSNKIYNLETFANLNHKWTKVILDITIGINYQPYTTNYAERKDLEVNKFALFGEVSTYPFQKNIFAGFRFEYASSWFTQNAIHTLDKYSFYAPNWYGGLGVYGITGVDIPVSTRIKFRAYSIYGIHVYEISKFEFISEDFLYRSIPGKTRIDFKIMANAGIIIQISEKKKKENVVHAE